MAQETFLYMEEEDEECSHTRYVEGDQGLYSDNEWCKREWFVHVTRQDAIHRDGAISILTSNFET